MIRMISSNLFHNWLRKFIQNLGRLSSNKNDEFHCWIWILMTCINQMKVLNACSTAELGCPMFYSNHFGSLEWKSIFSSIKQHLWRALVLMLRLIQRFREENWKAKSSRHVVGSYKVKTVLLQRQTLREKNDKIGVTESWFSMILHRDFFHRNIVSCFIPEWISFVIEQLPWNVNVS